MWEALSEWLSKMGNEVKTGVSDYIDANQGSPTEQTGSMAKNIAGGMNNSGWGSLYQDLSAGNYASSLGNALQMSKDGRQSTNQQSQPVTVQQAQSSSIPTYTPGYQNGQSSLLQQLSSRYLR